ARDALRTLVTTESADAARIKATGLSKAGHETLEEILHRDRAALLSRLNASITASAAQMAEVSPRGRIAALQVPVLLIHGSGDDVIPPTELSWLAREVPSCCLEQMLTTPLLSHVDLGSEQQLIERAKLAHWMAAVLHEADANH